MGKDVIFYGWNRSIPGREQLSAAHMQEYLEYLGGLQGEGTIDSFEVVLLGAHGGDLNGFFLIRGEAEKLDGLARSEAWMKHVVRGGLHLEGAGVVRGVTGEGVMEWMALWTDSLPE